MNKKGFTLVEIIVAVGIFLIVAFIALAALLMLTVVRRDAEASRSIVNSLDFAIDDIMRNGRLGRTYNCGPRENIEDVELGNSTGLINAANCSPDADEQYFMFYPAGTDLTHSQLASRQIYRHVIEGGVGRIEKSTTGFLTCDPGSSNCETLGTFFVRYVPITDPRLNVTDFRVTVEGSGPYDEEVSKVTLQVVGVYSDGTDEGEKEIAIQTSFVQRASDL